MSGGALHRLMNIGKNDEWYTPAYAVIPIVKYLKPNSVIWAPFDTCDSQYVKCFLENGFSVINTHIKNGQDFFAMKVPYCDYIISNPPYSKKTEVLQRLFDIGKPFAMLLGSVGIFDNRKRFDMFAHNRFEILLFDKRINYISNGTYSKSPPFQSFYFCHDVLPDKMIFEKLNKR